MSAPQPIDEAELRKQMRIILSEVYSLPEFNVLTNEASKRLLAITAQAVTAALKRVDEGLPKKKAALRPAAKQAFDDIKPHLEAQSFDDELDKIVENTWEKGYRAGKGNGSLADFNKSQDKQAVKDLIKEQTNE